MQRRYLSINFIKTNATSLTRLDLKSLALFCKRYTPLVSLDEPGGILLDTTGCETLFDGEQTLLECIRRDFHKQGFHIQAAIAPTPLCARAMARFKPFTILHTQDLPQALYKVPIEALELEPRVAQTLHELGIKYSLELFRLPRAQLLSRFGIHTLDRIDMLRGDKKDPRIYETEERDFCIDEPLCDVVRESDYLCEVIFHILQRLCTSLMAEGLGAQKLETTLVHMDRRTSLIHTALVKPSVDADRIFRLLKLKLDNIDAGLGIERIVMRAKEVKPLQHQFQKLAACRHEKDPLAPDLSGLLDTLFNRIGSGNVFQLKPNESHIPEKAFGAANVHIGSARLSAGFPDELRPTRLLKNPEPIDVIAMLPDSPPKRITWRRSFIFHVEKANGPERIENEWWNQIEPETRDYYQVEDKKGLRLWVFKQSLPHHTTPKWFIHGLLA